MKKQIGAVVLSAALGFSVVAAWAQDNGVRGAPPGKTGVGPGVGVGAAGDTTGGPVGGRIQPVTPNANPTAPNTAPQLPETPLAPQPTRPGNVTR
jgi:hypothetical protein